MDEEWSDAEMLLPYKELEVAKSACPGTESPSMLQYLCRLTIVTSLPVADRKSMTCASKDPYTSRLRVSENDWKVHGVAFC